MRLRSEVYDVVCGVLGYIFAVYRHILPRYSTRGIYLCNGSSYLSAFAKHDAPTHGGHLKRFAQQQQIHHMSHVTHAL